MSNYYSNIKDYAATLGLATGAIWLIGGLLGAYFSKGSNALFISALIVGGLPIITTLLAFKFNIAGSLFLIIEALSFTALIYLECSNPLILVLLFSSYTLPIVLSSIYFVRYWYKNATRI